MTSDPRPVVISAVRTPIGTAGGRLRDLTVEQLAGPVVAAVAERYPDLAVDDVILGNCTGPGGNVARVAALAAGLPVETPAATVDQQCSSGLEAVALGADRVMSRGGAVIVGGVESASTAPVRHWRADDGTAGEPYVRAPFTPAGWADPDMGVAADRLAQTRMIDRERQDAYAVRSHERAIAAQTSGGFAQEIVSVGDLDTDERPRSGMTSERMARFPAAFLPDGTVTAANSCGVNDGAAALLMVSAEQHARTTDPGLRLLGWADAGVDPTTPGLGIVPASQRALTAAGLTWADIDVIEFNEAFAAQILACADEVGIADHRICPQGGALALGHPWGASGAVLMVRLFAQLVHQQAGRYGIAAIAGGGGQGVAVVVERCP